jgi:hypothetical protein
MIGRWMIVMFGLGHVMQPSKSPAQCTLTISAPKTGERVKGTALAVGTAEIAATGYLWILAHREGLRGWWPQGGGSARINDKEWKVLVTYGVPGELGTFEVAAVVVNAQANENLRRWVQEAPARGFPPTDFPSSMEGCPIRTVVVEKDGQ